MTTAPSDAPTWRRRSVRHTFAATVLVLEALVVLFATLVGYGLRAAPSGILWAAGGVLVVVLVLASGMLRGRGGYALGSGSQVLVLVGGVVLLVQPVRSAAFLGVITLVVGVIFGALWVLALRLGGRIDREKAEWDVEHPDGSPSGS